MGRRWLFSQLYEMHDDLRKVVDFRLTVVKEKEITVAAVVADDDCESLVTAGWPWTLDTEKQNET